MTRKLIIIIVTLASVLACTANPRKAPIRRGSGGGAAAAEEAIEIPEIKELVSANKPCFELKALMTKLNAQTGKPFSVHLRDSDFLDKDAKPWKEEGKTKGEEEIATRARILINEEKPPLYEQFNGEETLSSKMLGPYLAVREQNECKTITFEDGKTFTITPNPTTPTVEEQQLRQQQLQLQQQQQLLEQQNNGNRKPGVGNPKVQNRKMNRRSVAPGMTLVGVNTPETRTYTIVGNRLHISIVQPAGAIENCKKESNTSLFHKSEYVLNFSIKKKIFSISPRLTELLKATLQNPTNLADIKPNQVRRDLARERGRAGGIQIGPDELQFYTRQITSGQLKQVACK